ncbi:MAG: hypothetical protein ACE5KM_17175, partial [Planctomycetaceae bacterium]
ENSMRTQSFGVIVQPLAAVVLVVLGTTAVAGDPDGRSQIQLTGWSKPSSVDLAPYSGSQCCQINTPCEECIERVPVQECVTGKKTLYDCKICYEYVSIPEVRYRWVNKWVTRDIPADYDKPVCKKQDGQNCYGQERWDKQKQACGTTRHCRSIEQKLEKADCKYCDCEPGQTTIKVRYKTCVKEPYTVYRRVKRPICVKQPRYEKVKVWITRHECRKPDCQACSSCGGAGCDSCISK